MSRNLFVKVLSLFLSFAFIFGVATPLLASAKTDATATTATTATTDPADNEEELSVTDEIVEVARSQIGFYESYVNKFTTWYYGYETSAYWCSIFVSWCADQVGAIGTAVPKRASVISMKNWFEERGRFYHVSSDYVPQKGDIVFINTAVDGTDDVHHVDIITQDGFIKRGNTLNIKCIGGNTSDLNYNGSEYVTEKTRPVDGPRAQVVGYAHPDYEKSTGILGSLVSINDNLMPRFIKFLYAKHIELIYKLESVFGTSWLW